MRVEILEDRLSDADDTGRLHVYVKGDVVTVPDDCARRWLAYGWAKDVSGAVATGERIPGTRKPLAVDDAIMTSRGGH